MKKVLLILLAMVFIFSACQSNEESGSRRTKENSESQLQTMDDAQETEIPRGERTTELSSDTDFDLQTEAETTAPTDAGKDFLKTYELFKEKSLIGRPLKTAIARYGQNYEQGGYGGSWTVMYDEITFLVDALEDFNEDQLITHVIVYGRNKGPGGESYGKTYDELKDLIPNLEEPFEDIMDGGYATSIEDDDHTYLFTWAEGDYHNEKFVSVLIGKTDLS